MQPNMSNENGQKRAHTKHTHIHIYMYTYTQTWHSFYNLRLFFYRYMNVYKYGWHTVYNKCALVTTDGIEKHTNTGTNIQKVSQHSVNNHTHDSHQQTDVSHKFG